MTSNLTLCPLKSKERGEVSGCPSVLAAPISLRPKDVMKKACCGQMLIQDKKLGVCLQHMADFYQQCLKLAWREKIKRLKGCLCQALAASILSGDARETK